MSFSSLGLHGGVLVSFSFFLKAGGVGTISQPACSPCGHQNKTKKDKKRTKRKKTQQKKEGGGGHLASFVTSRTWAFVLHLVMI